MLKRLGLFYLTLILPLSYAINLYLIATNSHSLRITPLLALFGVIIAYVGLAIWLLSYFHLGRRFGVLPRRQSPSTTGLYRYLKHPMYLGISLSLIGLSLAQASREGLICFVCFILPSLIIRAHFEEKVLKSVSH